MISRLELTKLPSFDEWRKEKFGASFFTMVCVTGAKHDDIVLRMMELCAEYVTDMMQLGQ